MGVPGLADLLRLHDQAYRLLMHLDRRASEHPSALGPEVVEALSRGESCARWLDEHRCELPEGLLPRKEDEQAFALMLSSFFKVSFDVERTKVGNALVDARLRAGRAAQPGQVRSVRALTADAIKYMLAAEGVRITNNQAKSLACTTNLRDDVRIVAYVYELGRRVKGKSKGPIVHRLWRSLPLGTRKTMDECSVRQSIQKVIQAAREMIAGSEE